MTNKGANVHEFVIMKAGTKVEPPFGDEDEGSISPPIQQRCVRCS